MDDSHLVIIFKPGVETRPGPVAVGLEDTTDSSYSERLQFGRAQRAHAGGTEDVHATCQRPEDLAMPHCRRLLERAIYQPDRRGAPIAHSAIDVALPRGRKIIGFQQSSGVKRGQCWAEEYDGLHDAVSARIPGVYSPPAGVHGPSKPGTTTRATGMPSSRRVRQMQ